MASDNHHTFDVRTATGMDADLGHIVDVINPASGSHQVLGFTLSELADLHGRIGAYLTAQDHQAKVAAEWVAGTAEGWLGDYTDAADEMEPGVTRQYKIVQLGHEDPATIRFMALPGPAHEHDGHGFYPEDSIGTFIATVVVRRENPGD